MPEPLQMTTLPASTAAPTGRRARQRADTRERLFEASLAEFRECGVASAQIDRIARTAGVVRGTFYFHFPTKDDVLLELKHRMEHQILLRMRSFPNEVLPLDDYLRRVADALVEATSLVGSAEVLREALSLYVRRPDSQSVEGASLEEEVTRRFASAQQDGELRQDLSAQQIAVLFLTSTFGFFAHLEGDELRAALDSLVGVVGKGIRA